MTLHNTLRAGLAALLMTLPGWATSTPDLPAGMGTHLDQIVAEARGAEAGAHEAAKMLRVKNPDFDGVSAKLQAISDHSAKLTQLVSDFEGTHTTLTAAQRTAFERMKQASAVLSVFVENKGNLLAQSEAGKKRTLLRAKADGIAKRAALVQESAARIRS